MTTPDDVSPADHPATTSPSTDMICQTEFPRWDESRATSGRRDAPTREPTNNNGGPAGEVGSPDRGELPRDSSHGDGVEGVRSLDLERLRLHVVPDVGSNA